MFFIWSCGSWFEMKGERVCVVGNSIAGILTVFRSQCSGGNCREGDRGNWKAKIHVERMCITWSCSRCGLKKKPNRRGQTADAVCVSFIFRPGQKKQLSHWSRYEVPSFKLVPQLDTDHWTKLKNKVQQLCMPVDASRLDSSNQKVSLTLRVSLLYGRDASLTVTS